MEERKSGPVKPPVLDLEARNKTAGTTGAKPADKPATNAKPAAGTGAAAAAKTPDSEKPKSEKPAAGAPASSLPLLALTGVGGAVLGAGLAFGIATFGLWPQPPIAPDTTSADISTLEQRIGDIEASRGNSAEEIASLGTRLDDVETGLRSEIASATQALDEKIAALPANGDTDLTPLQNQIAELSTRLDAIAAGASTDQANALGADLAALRQDIDALNARQSEAQSAVTDLTGKLNTVTSQIEAPPSAETSANAQLPLALSGFETATLYGRPFAAELQTLKTALPGLAIPEILASQAATGLVAPETLERDLAKAIPAMLAARPTDPKAGWQDALMNRAQSLLALRPTGDAEGNSPDAVIARLETAIARRQFGTANTLMQSLPQPMQQAADELPAHLASLATAEQFAASARSAALAPVPQDTETTQ